MYCKILWDIIYIYIIISSYYLYVKIFCVLLSVEGPLAQIGEFEMKAAWCQSGARADSGDWRNFETLMKIKNIYALNYFKTCLKHLENEQHKVYFEITLSLRNRGGQSLLASQLFLQVLVVLFRWQAKGVKRWKSIPQGGACAHWVRSDKNGKCDMKMTRAPHFALFTRVQKRVQKKQVREVLGMDRIPDTKQTIRGIVSVMRFTLCRHHLNLRHSVRKPLNVSALAKLLAKCKESLAWLDASWIGIANVRANEV